MNNSFKKIFSICASLSLSLNFLPTYNVLADDFVESYYSEFGNSFGDSFNENEFQPFIMSHNNDNQFGASFDDRHYRFGMSDNNHRFGISDNNHRFGISDNNHRFGISDNNHRFGMSDNNHRFGMSDNNHRFGMSDNNHRFGMSLHNQLSNTMGEKRIDESNVGYNKADAFGGNHANRFGISLSMDKEHINDVENAKKIAYLIYRTAFDFFDMTEENENRSAINKSDMLTNMTEENYFEKTQALLNRFYNTYTSYKKPITLTHDDFINQSKDKQLLYRGISSDEDNMNKSNEEQQKILNQYVTQLKNGEFFEGHEKSGMFATNIKSTCDIPVNQFTKHGIKAFEQSAEFYANKFKGFGKIVSFFYDPSTTTIINRDMVFDAYKEIYETLSKEIDNPSKKLFLSLFKCCGLPTFKAMQQLSEVDILKSYDWQYQIFNPGVLVFDEQDDELYKSY